MPANFDECFQTVPDWNPPSDFEKFWKDSIQELKDFPIQSQSKTLFKGSIIRESRADISFNSYGNQTIFGHITVPRKRGDRPIVIFFHDYTGSKREPIKSLTDNGIAQCHLDLRWHGDQLIYPKENPNDPMPEGWTPGYFEKNLDNPSAFYMKALYLDVLRAIEFVRLYSGVDSEKIILCGHGLGGSLATFGAAYSTRVVGLIAEVANFCHLTKEQLSSPYSWMKEIYPLYSKPKSKKVDYKQNLSYFDSVYFAKKIKVPALFSCGMEDVISQPKSIFGLFNHLNCDKRMQIYPTDGHEAGKERQENVNLDFYKEIFVDA
ncbi:acetylxylan esterase [Leptospira sp. GIMC2001]|uniref:acetylxylan esterase n=1 Tax=Leptospira sp. GIMC2001 TaxID=1513297 RepID=UPI00234ABB16|nr:acetylxylan esterase [Leptospira sp. GIMC2001]WCL48015.1 acetylxylan esterase [Leptospira sp. GIMC2001]